MKDESVRVDEPVGSSSSAAGAKCCGHLRSFPPYVGGDDDEIDGWQAECCGCGFRGRETPYVAVAYGELVKHLNDALRATRE